MWLSQDFAPGGFSKSLCDAFAPEGVFKIDVFIYSMCQHYQRQCWVKGSCCSQFWPCHRCHDDASNHHLSSVEINEVKCLNCHQIQTFSSHCQTCGQLFGEYVCEQCHYLGSQPTVHCNRCQMCHRGSAQDWSYCETCELCVKYEIFESHQRFHSNHPIIFRGASKLGCPICFGELSQGESALLRCGHILHLKCMELHQQYHDRCPMCAIPLTDSET